MRIIESNSEIETINIAKEIAKEAKSGQVYGLYGDLGVGKTVFSKGFGMGLDVKENIVSPTFTIICEYNARLPFYHFDLYRIEDGSELEEIGGVEYLYSDGVCLVEWYTKAIDYMPKDMIVIKIEKDLTRGVDYRKSR